MAGAFQDPDDRKYARDLRAAAPEEFAAYRSFSDTVMNRTDGAIPPKYREMIALAVAETTQCAYCLESHTKAAVAAGVTEEELAELTYITAALRAGAGAAHGMLAMKLFKNAQEAHAAHQ
ncbi:MAG TPA: carboxymuconolactone decarboxylase family protein [Streptosporangiaceae bacterium]|jgi:AhpD family alkylhydroperoxidase